MEEDDPASYGREPTERQRPHAAAPPDHTSHRNDSGDKKHQAYEQAYWIVTGGASVLATIATGVAAWYAVGAYNASLDSVAEARKQVVAAEEANKTARRTLAAAIGASVHAGPAEFRQLTQADDETKISIIVPLGNDGGTTTRGLTYAATCLPTLTPATNPYDHRVLDKKPAYNLTLPPKETVKPIICSYGVKEWALVMAAKGSIYVYGRATYRDTILPHERHSLEFCTRLDDVSYTASAFNPGPFAFSYECGQHNCADDECEAQR